MSIHRILVCVLGSWFIDLQDLQARMRQEWKVHCVSHAVNNSINWINPEVSWFRNEEEEDTSNTWPFLSIALFKLNICSKLMEATLSYLFYSWWGWNADHFVVLSVFESGSHRAYTGLELTIWLRMTLNFFPCCCHLPSARITNWLSLLT